MRTVADPQFVARLEGYSLVTAVITYHMPDYRSLLQEFIWQQLDVAPQFPQLQKFLEFWERELEGPIHDVRFVDAHLITPAEIRKVTKEFLLN